MTFSVCVAAGSRATRSIEDLKAPALVRSGNLAVAWSPDNPWVSSQDDGDVLVVLDGRLHHPEAPVTEQPAMVLQRYRDRGIDLAKGLLGDFVLVLLDRAKRTLVVARDPVGVRPWYHATRNGQDAGTPTLATLVSLPWVDATLDERVAVHYLAAIEESAGETFYRGIRTIRPGQTWSTCEGTAKTVSHHSWDIEPDLRTSWEDAADRARDVLALAVRSRLAIADSATSQCSGGLDSSSVVGTAALLGAEGLTVARLLFDSPRADERMYSDAVIEHWGIPVVSTAPWIPAPEENDDLAARLARPVPDANFTMFLTLYRQLASQGRRDGLTGAGGDDAFIAMNIGPRVISALQLRRWDVLRDALPRSVQAVRASWTDVVRPTIGYLTPPRPGHGFPKWVSPRAIKEAGVRSRLRPRAAKVTGIVAIDERLSTLTSGYNAAILETSAAVYDHVGKRDSHPFLDPRFIRATYGLDPWWPTTGGHYRAFEVAAFRDRLPRVVAERRTKADFSEVFWPQILDDRRLEEVRCGPLNEVGWLDQEGFDDLLRDAKRGMANAAIPLFRCLALDRWVRTQQ